MQEFKKFKAAVKFFKSKLEFGYRLSIRRVKLHNLDGTCEYKDDKYLIKINNSLNEAHAVDCLIHEIAHAKAWSKLYNGSTLKDHHGEEWGKAYSQVYRLYLTQFLDHYVD